MKSQRRHELKSNELADTLDQVWEFVRQHGSKLLAGVLLGLLAVAVGLYLHRNAARERAQAWQRLYAAISGGSSDRPDDLRRMAEQAGDKSLSALAWVHVGDMFLAEYQLGEGDRSKAAGQAEQAYQTVIREHPDNTLAKIQAQMNLGVLYESLGRWDEAKKIYQDVSGDSSLAGIGLGRFVNYRLRNLAEWQQQPTKFASTAPATNPTTTVATEPAVEVE